MDLFMRVNLIKVRGRERVASPGQTEKYMMENGTKILNMEVECGKVLVVIIILVNGRMVQSMV
jgi:hypothetical protein